MIKGKTSTLFAKIIGVFFIFFYQKSGFPKLQSSAIRRFPQKPNIINQNANRLKKITKIFENLQGDIKKSMKIFSMTEVVNRFYQPIPTF